MASHRLASSQAVTKSKKITFNHEKLAQRLFYLGLFLYLVALIVPGLPQIIRDSAYLIVTFTAGYHVMIEGFGDTIKQTQIKHRFTPNIHILMTLAAVGAILIGNFSEAALLILIFAAAHFLEEYAEGKSKREITKLMNLNPTEARRCQANGEWQLVPVGQLKIGDHVRVLNGDQIPTDGQISAGQAVINEAAITGESMPKTKTVNDEVFGGTINGNQSFTMVVTKDSQDTVFAKILQLVQQSQNDLSQTATKIKRIEPIYVKIVLALFPIFILLGPLAWGWTWSTSLYRGMVFLIAASPCALAASAVPATLAAISNLAKRGVLFKGGSYLTNLNELKAIAFDKTGTLTVGQPAVTDYQFVTATTEQTAAWLTILTNMERQSNHPLATAIVSHFNQQVTTISAEEMTVVNQVGQGLTADYQGQHYQIAKPSMFVTVPRELQQAQQAWSQAGKTVIYFAENSQVVAAVGLMDVPNQQAAAAIGYFQRQGITTMMITGDDLKTGQAIAQQLNIDQVVANVLPADKAAVVSDQQAKYGLVAMVGDGINDAPALVKADIGVAMGDGTDVAMDVADVVLMQNDLSKLSYAHRMSRRLSKIVWQNIVFSMLIVLLLVTLNLIGRMDLTIGVLAHEGSTLLVILNGLRLLLPLRK